MTMWFTVLVLQLILGLINVYLMFIVCIAIVTCIEMSMMSIKYMNSGYLMYPYFSQGKGCAKIIGIPHDYGADKFKTYVNCRTILTL